MTDRVEIRHGQYHDSVRLMQVTTDGAEAPGVTAVLVAMATDLNLRLLDEMGFDAGADCGPDDLVVAVRAGSLQELDAAFAVIDAALVAGVPERGTADRRPPSHLLEHAASDPAVNLALISVPGEHAFVEAMAALRAGLHVMVFSNNVAVEHELLLKQEAVDRGLLVMGPDCGTAIVTGVGLGFANVVRPGPVGIVGASGTGIQQLCCLLSEVGVGVRHALGTGSRDLTATIGAASTISALAALDVDVGIDVVVVVSKPPAPEVAAAVRDAAAQLSTPVVFAMLGEPAVTIEDAAQEVLYALGRPSMELPSWVAADAGVPRAGKLVGLFSGGSLRDEAASVVAGCVPAVVHELIDLGADEYTRGRPHPMIDPRFRLHEIDRAVADDRVGGLMVDVVLGHGAHPDPAAALAPPLQRAVDAGVDVTATVVGTADDPQGRDRQVATLREAGASVWLSNAAAARHAATRIGQVA